VIDVIVIRGVFFVVLDKKSEVSCCFTEASSKIGRKIKYLPAKQRTCQNVQGLRHWRENNHYTKDSRGSTSFPGSLFSAFLGRWKKDPGRVPFDQNFRKFQFKIKWNRSFPEIRFENFGSPFEVVLFSGNLEIPEISCSICHFYPV